MARRQPLAVLLVLSLMANAFCLPTEPTRRRRDYKTKTVDSKEISAADGSKKEEDRAAVGVKSEEEEDDDFDFDFDFDFDSPPPSTAGGSNIVSLLNIANALFPLFSSRNANARNKLQMNVADLLRNYERYKQRNSAQKRHGIFDNEIDISSKKLKTPSFHRQEINENSLSSQSDSAASKSESSSSESDSKTSESNSESSESNSKDSSENNASEKSVEENNKNDDSDSNSKQDSGLKDSKASDDNDSDYDEPDGDGQGGGIFGLLAGLSGDGDSDVSSLLATFGAIIGDLSADIELNAVISTIVGLFVGLLSEGAQNPGEIIAKYLLASLETITDGGADNNGAFFGKFLSTLVKGVSTIKDGDVPSYQNPNPVVDSAGFLMSLVMGLLGDMSKSSSGGSSQPWR